MMLSKRMRAIREQIKPGSYSLSQALDLIRSLPPTRFDQTVEVAFRLGVDPRKSDQVVRGSTALPHGLGKSVRVAVFASGADADLARQLGADLVGLEDLADQMKAGNMNFDVVLATPATMGVVGRLGPVLGPRGLMPNPKVGTVTTDLASAIKNFKSGQVRFRVDKAGIVHAAIGKISFDASKLTDNLYALLADVRKAKPAQSKGVYIKKLTLSSTMGPGINIDLSSLPQA